MADRCTGQKTSGDPCKGWRVPGSDKCRRHLPNPVARARAAVRAEVLAWGLGDTTVSPDETLLRLISQSAARVQRLSSRLEELVEEHGGDLAEAMVGDSMMVTGDGELVKVGEYVRGLCQLEAQERDRLAGFCAKAIAAGLAERQVRLAERMGQQIAEVLRAVLGDPELGLTAAQREAAPATIRRHLAAVAS